MDAWIYKRCTYVKIANLIYILDLQFARMLRKMMLMTCEYFFRDSFGILFKNFLLESHFLEWYAAFFKQQKELLYSQDLSKTKFNDNKQDKFPPIITTLHWKTHIQVGCLT